MRVEIVSVPYFLGRRGVAWGAGPERLLAEGLDEALRSAGHEAEVAEVDPGDLPAHELGAAFAVVRAVAASTGAAIERGAFPLVLAGNCHAAWGVVAGIPGDPWADWFDAHADFHTPETTASGFLDGTAVAGLVGWCWRTLLAGVPGFTPVDPARCTLIGTRSIDPGERGPLDASAIAVRPPDALRADGIPVRSGPGYVHVDLDVLDPAVGRANEYAEPGGLSVEEVVAHLAPASAAAIAAYDPSGDPEGRIAAAGIRIALALVEAATRGPDRQSGGA